MTESITKWKIDVKTSLAARIEHRLMDPMTRKPRYGMRTKLINALLERYLNENPTLFDSPALTQDEIDQILNPASIEDKAHA